MGKREEWAEVEAFSKGGKYKHWVKSDTNVSGPWPWSESSYLQHHTAQTKPSRPPSYLNSGTRQSGFTSEPETFNLTPGATAHPKIAHTTVSLDKLLTFKWRIRRLKLFGDQLGRIDWMMQWQQTCSQQMHIIYLILYYPFASCSLAAHCLEKC